MTDRITLSKENVTDLERRMRLFFQLTDVPPGGCVVFQCGTVVRLDCDMHAPISSFRDDDKLKEWLEKDYPGHRLPNTPFTETLAENQIDLEWSLRTAYPDACRQAYGCLMRSGYPLSGGPGADRIVYSLTGGKLYMVVFDELDGGCCVSVNEKIEVKGASENDHMTVAGACAAEERRLDYMFPKPYAYVGPDKTLHVLVEQKE